MEQFIPNTVGEAYGGEVWCKVYRDEGHWFASYMTPCTSERKTRAGKRLSEIEEEAKEAMRDAIQAGLRKKAQKAAIIGKLERKYEEYEKENLEKLADGVLKANDKNLFLRKRRLKRKAFTNVELWNYFVTVTRDDARYSDENAFRKAVDRCFSNLHSRRGWKIMGVWERGAKNGRLHFHCLAHIPEGEMVGELEKATGYSWKKKRDDTVLLNTWFGTRFGRTDFEPIDKKLLMNAVLYITKYLQKSFEDIRYSRGIITEGFCKIDFGFLALLLDESHLRGISVEDLWEMVKDQSPGLEKLIRATLEKLPPPQFKHLRGKRVFSAEPA